MSHSDELFKVCNKKTVRIRKDLEKEQGINFVLHKKGDLDYHNRIVELIVPESTFMDILKVARELNLTNLSKMDYFGGITYKDIGISIIHNEFNQMLNHTRNKKTKKYLKLWIDFIDKIEEDVIFHEIGL